MLSNLGVPNPSWIVSVRSSTLRIWAGASTLTTVCDDDFAALSWLLPFRVFSVASLVLGAFSIVTWIVSVGSTAGASSAAICSYSGEFFRFYGRESQHFCCAIATQQCVHWKCKKNTFPSSPPLSSSNFTHSLGLFGSRTDNGSSSASDSFFELSDILDHFALAIFGKLNFYDFLKGDFKSTNKTSDVCDTKQKKNLCGVLTWTVETRLDD